jgi:hypothetical protein
MIFMRDSFSHLLQKWTEHLLVYTTYHKIRLDKHYAAPVYTNAIKLCVYGGGMNSYSPWRQVFHYPVQAVWRPFLRAAHGHTSLQPLCGALLSQRRPTYWQEKDTDSTPYKGPEALIGVDCRFWWRPQKSNPIMCLKHITPILQRFINLN